MQVGRVIDVYICTIVLVVVLTIPKCINSEVFWCGGLIIQVIQY